MPVLSPFAQQLYADLAPMAWDDANQGYALAHYVNAISQMMEDVDALIRDEDGKPGWSQTIDIDRSPTEFLPWLAQFVGVQLDISQTDAEQRQTIKAESGMNRGTPAAIVSAIQKYLTGTKTVILRERYPGPYQLMIVTYTDETGSTSYYTYLGIYDDKATYTNVYNDYGAYSDPYGIGGGTSDQILAAIMALKPAGIVLTYNVIAGQDYAQLWTNYGSYSLMYLHYADYQSVIDDKSSVSAFTFITVYSVLTYTLIYAENAYQDIYGKYISY